MYPMVDRDIKIRIDIELKDFLVSKKLISRETYKSVLKRLLGINGKRI